VSLFLAFLQELGDENIDIIGVTKGRGVKGKQNLQLLRNKYIFLKWEGGEWHVFSLE
jgi:hypothetical protein